MGIEPEPRRGPRVVPLWCLALLGTLTVVGPGARERGTPQEPHAHPCPECGGNLVKRFFSRRWVCELDKRHVYTSRELGLT